MQRPRLATGSRLSRRSLSVSVLVLGTALLLLAISAGGAWGETTTTVEGATTTTGAASTESTTTTTGAASTESTTTTDTTAPGAGGVTTTLAGAPGAQAGLTPAPEGFAAPNPGLLAAQLGVQFWPEYDTNDVLVLLDVTLPATTVFPYQFSFYIPKGARLAGIAEIDDNGDFDYTLGTPQITPGVTMDMVTVTVPSRPVLRLEYYYDPGVGAPGAKSYTLAFQAPADAGQLSVGVQQPSGSSGFDTGGVLPQVTTDAQGFSYNFGTFSAVKAGDMLEIPVSYTRSSAEPSIPPGGGASDPAQQTTSNYLLWLLIVLVLAVGGIVAYRLFLRKEPAPARAGSGRRPQADRSRGAQRRPAAGGRGGSKAPQRSRERRATSERADEPSAGGPARFCTQCGGRLTKKDRFCPQCGHERES